MELNKSPFFESMCDYGAAVCTSAINSTRQTLYPTHNTTVRSSLGIFSTTACDALYNLGGTLPPDLHQKLFSFDLLSEY